MSLTQQGPVTSASLEVLGALARRLRVAAEEAFGPTPASQLGPAADVAGLLDAWVDRLAGPGVEPCRRAIPSAPTWLLLVALTGRYPLDAEVRSARRRLATEPRAQVQTWLLEHALAAFMWNSPLAELEVVGGVVVDVDFSARHDLGTGIQRVVRQLAPRWAGRPGVRFAAWNPGGALRDLDDAETGRVLRWSGPLGGPPSYLTRRQVIVPWRAVVVLPEVPAEGLCPALASLAEHSGNRVSLIGYDAIPVVSADLMPAAEPERFVRYLTVVKHAAAVSAISATAAQEFAGFVDMLPAQGLTGPIVSTCLLPVELPPATPNQVDAGTVPQVLVVGSHEPRKNHLAVLHAAERLWREGVTFELTFLGGSSWASKPFDREVRAARRRGRAVTIRRFAPDAELVERYRSARVTVFPSLHEGYGLPVAESLAVGTPVLSADIGAMREIAEDGGVLAVDPRDDDALTDGLRTLLLDDDVHRRLAAQAAARPRRTWDEYADEAWAQLVEDLQEERL